MKKRVAYLLVAALSVSMLAGCGSKAEKKGHKVDVEITDIMANAVKSIDTVESFGIGVSGEAKISGTSAGQDISMSGSVKGDSIFALSKSPSFSMDGKVSYKLSGGGMNMDGNYKAEAYGATEDDEMTVYANYDDKWITDSVDISEYVESFDELEAGLSEIESSMDEIDPADLEEFEEVFKLEDTTKYVGKKECYVISATIDTDDLSTLEKFDIDAEELETFETLKMKYSLYLDKNTSLPIKFAFNLAGEMNQDGVELKITKCNLEITFKVNEGKVKAVPSEAVDKAEETDLGLEDMFGDSYGLENEYDIPDYDDDYLDEDDDYNYSDNDDDNTASTGKYSFDENGDYAKDEIDKLPEKAVFMGKEVKRGIIAKDIKSGFTIDEEYSDLEIEAGDNGHVCLDMDGEDGAYIWFYVYNDTDKTLSWEECKIRGLDCEEGDGAVTLELDNGIKIGDSIEKVQDMYGNVRPSYVYNSEYGCEVQYEDENYDDISFFYDSESGEITGIDFKFNE